jgi:hypothetical protein
VQPALGAELCHGGAADPGDQVKEGDPGNEQPGQDHGVTVSFQGHQQDNGK